MTHYSPAYRDRIVEAYHEIKDISHESVIAFYEKNSTGIKYLDIEDQFEMLARYCKALFLTSNYQKHIFIADELIEKSIYHNIQYVQGVDVYLEALFDKAASLYNLGKIVKCKKILTALIRLNKNEKAYRYLLLKCYLYDKPKYVRMGRALCVLLTLSSALIIGIELIIVRTMLEQWTAEVEFSRNVLFLVGFGSFVISELIHRGRAYYLASRRVA